MHVPRTSEVSGLLQLVQDGNSLARDQIFAYLADRLRHLAHAMWRANRVRYWEQSGDLLQQALVRLHGSLEKSKVTNSRALFRLAALELRHALIDLARHYFGTEGAATRYVLAWQQTAHGVPEQEPFDVANDPLTELAYAELHCRLYKEVDALPEDERCVVDLLWISGISQVEAAAILGVDRTTVIRRWRRARLKLHKALADEFAELDRAGR